MHQPRVFYLIQQAYSALFRAADQALKQRIGLTASQQAILFILIRKNGVPISEIAEELRMGRSSLTQLIDRMTEKGFVRRQKNEEDERSVEIHIEHKGRQVVEATLPSVKGINAALLAPFTNKEQAIIERFLVHISTHAGDIVDQHVATQLGTQPSNGDNKK